MNEEQHRTLFIVDLEDARRYAKYIADKQIECRVRMKLKAAFKKHRELDLV